MALPCIHSWFTDSRQPGRLRWNWSLHNAAGEVDELELLAIRGFEAGGEEVPLLRWQAPRRLRSRSYFSATVSLGPVQQHEWRYFWPRLRVRGKGLPLLINGYGDQPIYASGRLAECLPLEPGGAGSPFCPTCLRPLSWTEVMFGASPTKPIPSTWLQTRTGIWVGYRRRKRERRVGMDASGQVYWHLFCPSRHPLPEIEGLSDRLIVSILGSKAAVTAYTDSCGKALLSNPAPGLFRRPGRNIRPGNGPGDLNSDDRLLLAVEPHQNPFPLSVWLFGLWDERIVAPSPQAAAALLRRGMAATATDRPTGWAVTPHGDGLILVVDPKAAALQGAAPPSGSPTDQLGKFIESINAMPGQKLRMSLAIVLTDCHTLIRDRVLPACIPWNLPDRPDNAYNALVQRDTSARLGEFVARHAPSLYKCAQNWFAQVGFFGVGNAASANNGSPAYRCLDALTWMLAQRGQIPVMKESSILKQWSSRDRGDYVFA